MKKKHLMRFIAIDTRLKTFVALCIFVLCLSPREAFACAWNITHNYYLFHIYDSEEFRERVDRISRDNWRVYLGSTEEYYYFDAKEVRDYAQKKGDDLMVSYVDNLERYIKCSDDVEAESWEYPTKDELAQRSRVLNSVLQYAKGKLTSRLRSQHGLLVMRCNMLLGKHADNVQFWEQTASKYIESVYKEMMQNIYAGALYKTGQLDKSGQLFAEMGDWRSLMTQYYLKRSCQAIREEYEHNPNSAVLPFLLQDFVNNTQEAVDEDGYGKMFVRDISTREAQQMILFAGQVVQEGRSKVPVMWMTAKAWLEFMLGNRRQAVTDINQTTNLEGTEWMKNAARVIRLYITVAQSSQVDLQFDSYVATELEWMERMNQETKDGFFGNALDRIVHQHLAAKYAKAGRIESSMGLLSATDAYEYGEALDTLEVHSLISYLHYFDTTTNPLDRFLSTRLDNNSINMEDLIGTKYLRICQWNEAIDWLKKVPMSYYNNKGYAVYAAKRTTKVEPWIKRQWLPVDMEYEAGEQHMTTNPKIDFATDMQTRERQLPKLKGKSYQQACYDLAVRYAQASYTGDCWFLMRDGKSYMDTLRVHEVDLHAKAIDLLRQAAETTDVQLREHALFALSFGDLYPEGNRWYRSEWNRQTGKYRTLPQTSATQYLAFSALADFEKTNSKGISTYVSRCDEYIQFRKSYKN